MNNSKRTKLYSRVAIIVESADCFREKKPKKNLQRFNFKKIKAAQYNISITETYKDIYSKCHTKA